jgi:signal peptidase I
LNNQPRKPWVAAVLTLLSRGLGHLYTGNPRRGVILFVIEQLAFTVFIFSAVVITPDIYFLIIAIILSLSYAIFCVCDAMRIAKQNENSYTLKSYNRWYVYAGYFIIFSLCISGPLSDALKDHCYHQARWSRHCWLATMF